MVIKSVPINITNEEELKIYEKYVAIVGNVTQDVKAYMRKRVEEEK